MASKPTLWKANPKLQQCVQALYAGEVVAYPTEAVWGLGCDPYNWNAVEQILRLKGRSWKKGLILIAGDVSQLEFLLADLNEAQRNTLLSSWPGPNTWLVPHRDRVPKVITGEHDTVALRVTEHPLVRALCKAFDGPIVSTSANPQGMLSATSSMAARRYFGSTGIHFSPGTVGASAKPSTIRDLATGRILR